MKFFGLFRKKGVSEPETETVQNPYLNAREIWNDRLAAVISSRQMWQVIAVLSFLVSIGSLAGILQIARQSKFIPYVVAVDQLGRAVSVAPAQVAKPRRSKGSTGYRRLICERRSPGNPRCGPAAFRGFTCIRSPFRLRSGNPKDERMA